ncbi:MAG: hypothetical protein Phyf2KO_25670 [Phycisphaerales bacterium]
MRLGVILMCCLVGVGCRHAAEESIVLDDGYRITQVPGGQYALVYRGTVLVEGAFDRYAQNAGFVAVSMSEEIYAVDKSSLAVEGPMAGSEFRAHRGFTGTRIRWNGIDSPTSVWLYIGGAALILIAVVGVLIDIRRKRHAEDYMDPSGGLR